MMDYYPGLPAVQKAWAFAARRHQNQKYPGTDLPYLVHIGSVVLALIPALEDICGKSARAFPCELALCCAILHDTVEDTGTSPGEIRELFGEAVAAGVSALTKNRALPREEAMRDSLLRIRQQPEAVWMVKLADRIANLGVPPAHWAREKCLAYAGEGRLILDALGPASPVLATALASRIAAWQA